MFLTLLLFVPTFAAAKRFYYNELSCEDMRPRRLLLKPTDSEPEFGANPALNPQQQPQFPPGGFATYPGLIPGQGVQIGPGEAVLTKGPSPFYIRLSDTQYKKDRFLTVNLIGSQQFDGFIIQARPVLDLNSPSIFGSASGTPPVGQWTSVPESAGAINCRGKALSAVVDGVDNLAMQNLTFRWLSPTVDVGDIVFVASVLLGDRYWIVTSDRVRANPFPTDLTGCGTKKSCFRLCPYWWDNCPITGANIIAMFETSTEFGGDVAVITLGGYVSDNNTYVAVGFGKDPLRLSNLDINACFRSDGQVLLAHYIQESPESPPYLQSGVIVPEITDSDGAMLWCRFRRPLRGTAIGSLMALNQPLYQFYFRGSRNDTVLGAIPAIFFL